MSHGPYARPHTRPWAPRACVLHSMAFGAWCKLETCKAPGAMMCIVLSSSLSYARFAKQESSRAMCACKSLRAIHAQRARDGSGAKKWRTLARSERRTLLVSPLSALDPLQVRVTARNVRPDMWHIRPGMWNARGCSLFVSVQSKLYQWYRMH